MKTNPKSCRLCLQDQGFVDAHIIPRSFYKEITRPAGKIIDANLHYTKKSPTGIYDDHLVCATCEDRFKTWDDYGFKLLIQNHKEENYEFDESGKRIFYRFDNVDYDKLKLFFISVLWRVSATTQPFFEGVSLGPHENLVREMILSAEPGDHNKYSIALQRFNDDEGRETIFPPYRSRYSNVNVVVLSMGGYLVYITVDKRPPPKEFDALMLKPTQPLYVMLRDYDKSTMKQWAFRIFQQHFKKKDVQTTIKPLQVKGSKSTP